jgi:hypothetical protein
MRKGFSIKNLLLVFPVIYIIVGWYVGLTYGRKPVIFGPYPDIPVVVKTGLLGSSLEDISGTSAIMMVVLSRDAARVDQYSTYFTRAGYFEIPGTWKFDFAPSGAVKKTFLLSGGYSRAICHDLKSPERRLGILSIEELDGFLKIRGRTKDLERLKPYLPLAKLEERYPWAYSETVLLSKAMGNIFTDDFIPYDVLGLVGIAILFIALASRSLFLWTYYLYWVFSYWFGRIGFHDPVLIFTREGQGVILWSFWNGFILKEGRLFLIIAMELSVIVFGILGVMYASKQISSSLKRAG